jgi:hypothetical protein
VRNTLASSVVDWGGILEVIWASLLAGVGVTAAFGFTILGATRASELSREGKALSAGLYGVLGVVAFAAVVASVVFGIVVMTTK